MKVSELIYILNSCNPDARVVMCYDGYDKSSCNRRCFYSEVDDVGYRQVLTEDRQSITTDENIVQIWAE